MAQSSTYGGGIGFPGVLAFIFITLKLTHVIAWPWVWVLSPIWICASFVFLVCATLLVVYLLKK